MMMEKKKKKERGTRKGFTTGACSAAAARAATLGLLTGKIPESIECLLPNGEKVNFTVTDAFCDKQSAHAVVIKDAGDDPDCTDKAPLTADVRFNSNAEFINTIQLKGGIGVGTIGTWI